MTMQILLRQKLLAQPQLELAQPDLELELAQPELEKTEPEMLALAQMLALLALAQMLALLALQMQLLGVESIALTLPRFAAAEVIALNFD